MELMVTGYRIRNWRKHQHYKGRSPPWVKLYRELVDERDWRGLSGGAGKLLMDLILLASEKDHDGEVSGNVDWLAWRLRVDSKRLAPRLTELVNANWLIELNGDASAVLAGGEQDATPEKRREEKSRSSGVRCERCNRPLKASARGRLSPCLCKDS